MMHSIYLLCEYKRFGMMAKINFIFAQQKKSFVAINVQVILTGRCENHLGN